MWHVCKFGFVGAVSALVMLNFWGRLPLKMNNALYDVYVFYNWFSVPPMIRIQNQMIGASISSKAMFDCYIEAFPPSVTYWERSDGRVLEASDKYQVGIKELGQYKVRERDSKLASYCNHSLYKLSLVINQFKQHEKYTLLTELYRFIWCWTCPEFQFLIWDATIVSARMSWESQKETSLYTV